LEQIETYFSYCLIYVSDQIINQVSSDYLSS